MENLQLLVLTGASEKEAVHSGFQSQCIILDYLHLHNQSVLETMLVYCSFMYYLWDDNGDQGLYGFGKHMHCFLLLFCMRFMAGETWNYGGLDQLSRQKS
jgi:hypothetical protein